MRSNLGFISSRVGAALEANGTQVRVSWVAWPLGSLDPVTMSHTGAPAALNMVVMAFLHFPQPTVNSAVRQFNEVEVGDCIADFDASVKLDGKDKLEFVFLDADGNPVDGQKWVTKPTNERLAQTWGAVIQGVRLLRPVLLRKAT